MATALMTLPVVIRNNIPDDIAYIFHTILRGVSEIRLCHGSIKFNQDKINPKN